jgi:superfamily II DNA/RNA helicase
MPTFTDLGLSPAVQEQLAAQGITEPSPIQAAAIPALLQRKDALVHAQTGSGKTLAYLLPMFARLEAEEPPSAEGPPAPGGVVLVPTQELGMQVQGVVKAYGWSVAQLIGGANPARQIEQLKKRPRIVVGTPGRILQLIRDGKLSGRAVRVVVGDEADQLFEPAHRKDLDAILKATSPSRQTVLVTATAGPELKEWLPKAEVLRVEDELKLPATLKHQAFIVDGRERVEMVRKLVRHLDPKGAIAFVSRPADVDWWVEKLRHHNVRVAGLHSGIPKLQRAATMRDFKSGKLQLLLATELASRGLDLGGVSLVVNMELPTDPQHYVHRVGRTARMGRAGTAVTLATPKEAFVLGKLEKALGITFERPVLKEGEVREATPIDLKVAARKAKHEEKKAEAKAEVKAKIAAGEVVRPPKKSKTKGPTAKALAKGKAKKAEKKARAAASKAYHAGRKAEGQQATEPPASGA